MTTKTDEQELLPCPFCGSGTTEIQENGRTWLGTKWGEPVSVSVRHWCDHVDGQPSRMIERVGRDRTSAIDAWNRRADLQSQPLTVDALAQEIRRVNGDHSLGAGALAEALMPFIQSALQHSCKETSQDREDALRYRYLRNEAWGCNKNKPNDMHVVLIGAGVLRSALTELAEESLDEAIDRARRIKGEGK